MLRQVVLGVADRALVRKAVTGGAGRKLALRFVAGETLDEAVDATRALNEQGATVSLDHLGENVADLDACGAATLAYLDALDRIDAEGLQANISVKLTQMGLDVAPDAAHINVQAVTKRAAASENTVTLDMEDHRYTDRTIDTCLRLQERYPGAIGIAIQAYLRRTPDDLRRLMDGAVGIRLCKGAYNEPATIAYRGRREVAEAYARLTTELMGGPSYAMIATHDEALIRHALEEAKRLGRAPETFELQMLYGVRRELQRALVAQGARLRVYVPYGDHWYPYLMRRIAERPANMRFLAEALLRE